MNEQAKKVLDFWFSPQMQPYWFAKSDDVDAEIRAQFLDLHADACAGRLDDWKQNADTALALTIVFDQFPRNMFRGSPQSFASDGLALDVAIQAMDHGFDREVSADQRQFFYLPLMHSEDLDVQNRSVEIYQKLGNENSLDFARQHRDIIAQFGRFPHRNKVLGRENTAEETEFLKTHSGF